MELEGTTVYVSGGASGLGAATVAHLAARGAAVGILDRDVDRGEQVAARTGAALAHCDVTSADSMETAFAALFDRIGPPRVAIACGASVPAASWSGAADRTRSRRSNRS